MLGEWIEAPPTPLSLSLPPLSACVFRDCVGGGGQLMGDSGKEWSQSLKTSIWAHFQVL